MLWLHLLFACSMAQQSTDPKDLAVVEGRVLGADGAPIRKASLTLQSNGGKPGEGPQSYGATSDAEGKFIFDGIDPGRYTLSGYRAGYLRSVYGSKRELNPGTALTVASGQRMQSIELVLKPQASVSGRIVDEDGDPVVSVQMQLLRNMYMNGKRQLLTMGYGQTDEKGDFKCGGLQAGRYYLQATLVKANGFGDGIRKTRAQAASEKADEEVVPTYYPGVTDPSAAQLIEVSAGRDVQGITLRLRRMPVYRIKGKVTGSPPVGAAGRLRVMAAGQTDNLFFNFGRTVAADKSGAFELVEVQPGTYDLIAMSAQGLILARQPVQVGNRDVTDIVLVAQPAGIVRGSVKIDPPPPQGASDFGPMRINLVVAGTHAIQPNTNVKDDGTFTLDNVSPDRYSLRVFNNPDGTYLKAARMGDLDLVANGLDLTSGVSEGMIELTLSSAAGAIDGTVQNNQQQPAAGRS